MTQREEFEAWWEEFCSAHEDWRFADSDALRWAAWQAAKAAQPSQAGEPVVYQSRMRPLWGQSLWTEWSNCTKGMHDDYKKTPILNDWEFEARALSVTPQGASPQPSQAGLSEIELEAACKAAASHGNSLGVDSRHALAIVAAYRAAINAKGVK